MVEFVLIWVLLSVDIIEFVGSVGGYVFRVCGVVNLFKFNEEGS